MQFCAAEYPRARLAGFEGSGPDRSAWSGLHDLGVFALRVPERDGGLGRGWVETVVVYEVLGAFLVPGPLVWTQLAVGLTGAGDGAVGAVTGVDATVPGEPLLVEHPGLAGALLVLRADGVTLVPAGAWGAVEPLESLDPLTPIGRLAALPDGPVVAEGARVAALRREGAVLAAALAAGVAGRALEEARAYALERRQFGQPIGAFQAVQHLLADMYVRSLLARSAVYAAAALLDDPGAGDAAMAASSAKVVALDAAMANARACIQVHGAMGFTWEMMPHYLLKRAWVLEHTFDTGARHAERIAAGLGSSQ